VTADADQSMTIPLTVEVGAQMLSVSKRGIAFTDTPDVSLLQTSVEIGVNVERTAEWSASSNVGWLTVTPSGTTNDSMFITADTASLANEVISEAVITISSSETEITSDETIALALWKSIEPPTNQPIDFVLDFQGADVLSDPIRPYAYVQTMGNLLNVINVYSGILVDTITLENDFTDFDISDDGTFLYAVRSGDGEGFIDAVNLSAALVETTWAYPVERLSAGTMQKISFGRVAGAPFLFTSTQRILSAVNGQVASTFPQSRNQTVLTGLDVENEVLCTIDNQFAEGIIACFDLISAGFVGASVNAFSLGSGERIDPDAASDIVLSSNGEELYIRSFQDIETLDTPSFSLSRTISENNSLAEAIQLDANDNLFAVYVDPSDFLNERRFVIQYAPDGTEINSTDFPSIGGGLAPILDGFVVSADGQRLVYLTNEALLEVNFLSVE